ncbi:hypothetical protein FOA52_000073 [Chlamydomonas sp. UWO 241]|nr:hypothetical protein FOA52_000073 [Chlamydomonas sp. UWO 241]
MGWSSWNYFRCDINESMIRQVADAMVDTGLRDAGYKYVNIDDCWMKSRGPDDVIQLFNDKFPNGMKAVGDYIHSKGLLFGIYSAAGNTTCEGYPGSWGHEEIDARTYAEWGVDYLKYDYCSMDKSTIPVRQAYEKMRDALNKTGRPIMYNICSWGAGEPHKWGQEVGHSWRTGIDLFAAWDDGHRRQMKLPSFLQSVLTAINQQANHADYAGPGGFNDPDMLVVGLEGMYPYGIVQDCPEHVAGCKPGEYISRDRWGRVGGLTHTEQRTHFAFWCMLAAPLILGNDPRHMTQATLDILLSPEIVALSQDSLGRQARKVWSVDDAPTPGGPAKGGGAQIWAKPLADGRLAVLMFNMGDKPQDITLDFARDLPDDSDRWARDIPLPDDCKDKDKGCADWAKAGECAKNAAFMLDRCPRSCQGCGGASAEPGPHATSIVRDAWMREDLGAFTSQFTATHVEPHEARVVTLTFMEPADALSAAEAIVSAQAKRAARMISGSGSGGSADDTSPSVATTGDATALDEELAVLREELANRNRELAAEKVKAETMAQWQKTQEHVAKTLHSGGSDGGSGAIGIIDGTGGLPRGLGRLVGGAGEVQLVAGWQGKVLIALNVALAAAVLLLMRRARAQAKAAKHTQ